MTRVVVLAGGVPHAHDFAATGAALADLYRAAGDTVAVVDHPDAVVAALAGADVLVVSALYWTMAGDAYDAWRAEWAYTTPPATRRAIAEFVGGGGGLVANHTASICFDDWPEWGDIVGGAWQWGVSSHPPAGPVHARVAVEHPVVAGVGEQFELVDEVYGDLAVRPGIEVLATAQRTPDDADQPVVWAHRYGAGRVVYDGFGHDAASITDANNARVLTQALEWATGGN